jgi:protein gp37
MSTTIEWTHFPGYQGDSWNPVVGCSRKSSGCTNCYAELMASRIANASLALLRKKAPVYPEGAGVSVLEAAREHLTPTQVAYLQAVRWRDGGYDGPKYFTDVALPQWSRKLIPLPHQLAYPLKKQRPTCFFVNSMSDLFHESVPFDFIDQVFATMALCPEHFFLILTKRPDRMAEYTTTHFGRIADRIIAMRRERGDNGVVIPLPNVKPGAPWWPLPNVGLSTSVEDQKTADERIPHLLRCRAALRFLSCEPLLGAVDLWPVMEDHKEYRRIHENACFRDPSTHPWAIQWVIVGGESGRKARPMHPDWARSLRDQCTAAGVPFFFKQWGEWAPGKFGAPPKGRRSFGHWVKWYEGHRFMEGEISHDDERIMYLLGKQASGNLLDGVAHQEWPAVITERNAVPA